MSDLKFFFFLLYKRALFFDILIIIYAGASGIIYTLEINCRDYKIAEWGSMRAPTNCKQNVWSKEKLEQFNED